MFTLQGAIGFAALWIFWATIEIAATQLQGVVTKAHELLIFVSRCARKSARSTVFIVVSRDRVATFLIFSDGDLSQGVGALAQDHLCSIDPVCVCIDFVFKSTDVLFIINNCNELSHEEPQPKKGGKSLSILLSV